MKILKKPYPVDSQRAFSTIIKYNEILSFSVKIDARRYAILDIYCRCTQICYFFNDASLNALVTPLRTDDLSESVWNEAVETSQNALSDRGSPKDVRVRTTVSWARFGPGTSKRKS
jgi:hypothetical protein